MCMSFHFSTIHHLILVFDAIGVLLRDLYLCLVHVFMNHAILLYYIYVHIHHERWFSSFGCLVNYVLVLIACSQSTQNQYDTLPRLEILPNYIHIESADHCVVWGL